MRPGGCCPVPSCSWTNAETTASIGVSYYPARNKGLSNAYTNVKPQMKRWDVLPPIQGFPAVAYATQPGSTPNTCDVLVGVTDRLSFLVDVAPRTSKMGKIDPCPLAADVANDVLTTLKRRTDHTACDHVNAGPVPTLPSLGRRQHIA
ncbi:DUF3558 family protein [Amycolatopsis sulphurea]|uniref:DUF3558 family protein n=1 Tax=Amycolatopsis sulphurea TaxID=76022 RepID=UPI001474C090|nr:DUF3558 family protein [Amycolatopsis sulphurea]